MKIDIKQPKYVLPVILLPFICFFFYLWQSEFAGPKETSKVADGLNPTVAGVSDEIRRQDLADKLDAFRNTYKESSGTSAVNAIPSDVTSNPGYNDPYVKRQQDQRMLDSITALTRQRFSRPPPPGNEIEQAVAGISKSYVRPKENDSPDPMDLFKQQMSYMDSITRENDPDLKAERQRRQAVEDLAARKAAETRLKVTKRSGPSSAFHTLIPAAPPAFISAVIDENVTGYGGSRLRLRLLEDIKAGNMVVKKGTYVYALITGFSEQRVMLTVSSILFGDKILPVGLQLYDLDGLPGLYVPASAFRDFTKDLGGNTMQGVSIGGTSAGSQFIMSTVDKVFQSTSSAIASLLRKNKVRLKYNTYIYLIDTEALQSAQKNY